MVRLKTVVFGISLAWAIVTAPHAAPDAPPSPTGLAAWYDSLGGVWLAWDVAPRGQLLTGYFLEAGSGPWLTDMGTLARSSSEPSFTTTNVPAGTYYVRVRAMNGQAMGPASNEVRLIVRPTANDPGGPDIPSLTSFRLQGSTGISLSWQPPLGSTPATSYTVEAGSWPGMNDLGEVVTRDTSLTVTDIPTGVYYVNLYARNDRGTRRLTYPYGLIVTPSCSYAISGVRQTPRFLGNALGSGVQTSDPRCAWMADTDRDWISLSVGTGPNQKAVTGTGDGGFSIAAADLGPVPTGLIKFRGAGREIDIFVKASEFFR